LAQGKTNNKGITDERIQQALGGVPGMTLNAIRTQMTTLRASGDFARIIAEVTAQVEEEKAIDFDALEAAHQARVKAEARAEAAKIASRNIATREAEAEARAAEAEWEAAIANEQEYADTAATRNAIVLARKSAPKNDPTFDLSGVSKHLLNAAHIETYRRLVTAKGIVPYLPVNQQARLAAELVQYAKNHKPRPIEMTSAFLRERVMEQLINVKITEKQINRDDQQRLMRQDWNMKSRLYQEEFARNARGMLSSALELIKHSNQRPPGVTMHLIGEFISAMEHVEEAIRMLRKEGIV
jgi:hypothetical protein